MSIDIADIFRTLIPASFRGVDFWMPDSRITVGRRVQKFLFPGRDDFVWEDLGALDGPIQINGILVGDDYVEQAQAMAQAFRTPGPAQLRHPWLGEQTVILPQPGTLSFDQTHLRLVRIEFTVELYDPTQPAPLDTLGAVLAAIQDVQDQANAVLSAVLAPLTLTVAAVGIVQQIGFQVAGVFGGVAGAVGFVASAISGPLGGLLAIGELSLGVAYPASVGAALAAPGAAIAATSATLLPAAIGPGDIAPSATPQDPRATATILLAAVGQIAVLGGAQPAPAIVLAVASFTLANAIDAAGDIAYSSQQDALVWLAQLTAAIDLVAALAAALGPALPASAGAAWRSAQVLRAAVAADINAQIGRLPVVQIFSLASSTPAWLVAQALAGDTPGQVLAMYRDLVARNSVAYPLAMGPGAIEALVA